MSNVELGTLSAVLGSSERVQADPFAVASDVAAICAQRNYDHVAQEIVLRALNKLECFEDYRRVIEALVRQCGLFRERYVIRILLSVWKCGIVFA